MGDLDGASATSGGSRWTATVTVAAHDAAHAPLAGVTVTGSWGAGAAGTCLTNAAGTCPVTRRFSNRRASATLTVTGLSLGGYTYGGTSNHDPEGDSNGTSITVLRP